MIKWDFWKKSRRQSDEVTSVPWRQPGIDRYADTTRSSLFSAGDDDWDVMTAKPEFSSQPSNNPRSYEDFLRARGHHSKLYDTAPSNSYSVSGRRMFAGVGDEPKLSTHRAMQLLGAVALTTVLYFTFQSESPLANKVQTFTTQALSEDTDISALSAWWQENVTKDTALPASTGPKDFELKFVLPVTGEVKLPYDGNEQQGVTFTTALGADVSAVAKGVVEKVEKEGSEDYSVTISHGTTGKTIYRHLVTVDVKQDAWVEGGQKIGGLSQKGEHGELFFAYQVEDKFLNPADILKLPEVN
ncbi:peptidoglycan DD-metalloendopeptidase family protein [Tumebacillus lipolyticus]|uniref:Peptidoglycan DD-metalloendopeptidase family protein n=1 Tax=Tumebacillus lipolyticus TaxID=1280370 RepID=A0ABW4ZUM6_9BACL